MSTAATAESSTFVRKAEVDMTEGSETPSTVASQEYVDAAARSNPGADKSQPHQQPEPSDAPAPPASQDEAQASTQNQHLDTIQNSVPVRELRLPNLPARSTEGAGSSTNNWTPQPRVSQLSSSPTEPMRHAGGPPPPPSSIPHRGPHPGHGHRRSRSNDDLPPSGHSLGGYPPAYQHHHHPAYQQQHHSMRNFSPPQMGYPYGYPPAPPPPASTSPQDAHYGGYGMTNNMQQQWNQANLQQYAPAPFPGQGMRGRTWSEGESNVIPEQEPFLQQQMPPPSPRGGRQHHGQWRPAEEGTPLLPRPPLTQSQSARAPSSRRGRRHRKSVSSGAAMPGGGAQYGAFWSGEPDAGRTTRQQHQHQSDPSFSPRGEFMSLAAGFRGNGNHEQRSPRASPPRSQRQVLSDRVVSWSPNASPQRQVHSDQAFNWSPNQTQPHPMMMPAPLTPTTPYEKAFGEAAYTSQKKRKGQESSRKMHRRQQSAQIMVQDVKGVEQPAKCRDVVFFLLFVFHLILIVYVGDVYGKKALVSHPYTGKHSEVTVFYKNLVYIACLSGGFAVVVSASVLAAMTFFARNFLKIALMIVITLSFIWGTIGIGLAPQNIVPITGIIALALSIAYAFIVWDRIPFAAANLLTALSGVRAFPATILFAFVFQALVLLFSVYYVIVLAGVYDAMKEGALNFDHDVKIIIYVLLGISCYWTFQVLSHVVQVATAGVIRRWWFDPERKDVVRRSAFKTIFFSMGSVCFGSLFVGPVRILRMIGLLFRPNPEQTSLMCLSSMVHCFQTCVTTAIDTLADRFNPFAFTYIGLYGYGFLDAGHKATELFERRGWTTIVSDDLVPNVLLMTSLVLGGITGCFAYLIDRLSNLSVTSLNEPGPVSFWVGVGVGLVLTSVLFGVISSATNAVLVLFASSPLEFEQNHPELSHEMRASWREVWPGALDVAEFDVGDIQDALAVPSYAANHGSYDQFDPELQ